MIFISFSVVHNFIQQHVVKHFGYDDINALRTALFRFPDDPMIKEAFYGKLSNTIFFLEICYCTDHRSMFLVKHNKITQGQVNQGQCARDVDLFTPDGQCTTLFAHMTASQPLVILAGSTS